MIAVAVAAQAGEPRILAPTQGRPVFVRPGALLATMAQFDGDPGSVRFELVSRAQPAHRRPLSGQARGVGGEGGPLRYDLRVPEDMPEQTYDLRLSSESGVALARHAVAVQRIGQRVRLVHLSNMNIGDVGAPMFDWRLVDEINLIAPTLIVATGDFLDATHHSPQTGWEKLSDFLASFDAPVLVACGDHDDVGLYCRYMASSPIGTIEVGPYEGIVLFDLPGKPITEDPTQIQWVEQQLARPGPRMRFIVSHDDCPNLLAHWQRQGTLEQTVKAGRLGLWFSGGHRDWDGREHAQIVTAAAPMMYLRTHQSSTTTREGAEGVSHYRVVDLEGERAKLHGEPSATAVARSLRVGWLKLSFDGANDGSTERVVLTAVSALPFRIDHLAARVLVRREGKGRPWCHGARLKRLVDMGSLWECWVGFDLPDKGALRAVVGVGAEPAEPAIDVDFDVPRRVRVRTKNRPDKGVDYIAGGWRGMVYVHNTGGESVQVEPLVRLDGETVAYRVVGESGPYASAYRLRLGPDQTLALQLDLSVARVDPGRRELQVYLRRGVAQVPVCWPVEVISPERGGTE